jgi:serine protease Do
MKRVCYRRLIANMVAIAAIFLLSVAIATPARAQAPAVLKELGSAFVQVAEKVTPTVVNISSSKKTPPEAMREGGGNGDPLFKNHPFREFFGDEFFKRFKKDMGPRGFNQHGLGSGLIVSADGMILTNAHVVKDADEIKVTLGDKRSFKAKVIGADPESDVAVLKIDAKDLPTGKFADSDKLRVGEIVIAVGNPFGFNQTVTSGIVSAKGRSNVGIIDYEDFIQTDAAINPGNSGGPLVNIEGEVVGITTAIASRSGGYQGIGFAIPSNSAKLIMDDLVKTGKVRRGLLGVNIQDVTDSLAKSFGRAGSGGALVSQVIEGGPADKAGIKAGDIILKFNGEPVSGAAELKNLVGRVKPGSTAKLSVFRNKETVEITAHITERTKEAIAAATPSSSTPEASNELGIEISSVPASVSERLGLKNGGGVEVKDVSPDGEGAKMGLKVGDVILEVDGKVVADVSTFNNAVTAAKTNKLVRLKVRRGNGTIFLATPLG